MKVTAILDGVVTRFIELEDVPCCDKMDKIRDKVLLVDKPLFAMHFKQLLHLSGCAFNGYKIYAIENVELELKKKQERADYL